MLCDKCRYIEQCPAKEEHGGALRCSAFKSQEQTNDEWRQTCSAEEFATWLWKHFDNGEVIVLWEKYGSPMYKNDNGVNRADYTEAMKKWLKEKHDESV